MEYILPLDEIRIYVVIEESDGFFKGQQIENKHEKPSWQNVRAFSKKEKSWMFVSKEQANRVQDWRAVKKYD